MNNDNNLTTPRDIRLKLASMLDQMGQIQNSESWQTLATEHPTLGEQYQIAQTNLDDLWFYVRCATTNPGD